MWILQIRTFIAHNKGDIIFNWSVITRCILHTTYVWNNYLIATDELGSGSRLDFGFARVCDLWQHRPCGLTANACMIPVAPHTVQLVEYLQRWLSVQRCNRFVSFGTSRSADVWNKYKWLWLASFYIIIAITNNVINFINVKSIICIQINHLILHTRCKQMTSF